MRPRLFPATLIVLAGTALSQQAPPAVSAHAIAVVLHDKKGAPQQSVGKQELQLIVDSKPAPIDSLEPQGNKPLLLGLIIDTAHAQEQVLGAEKTPDEEFLDKHVSIPGDKSFVIHFDKDIELMQDLTADKAQLHSAVQDLQPASSDSADDSSDRDNRDDEDDSARPHRAGGSRLYDAIFLASDEILKPRSGRKAIVVVSDGVDHGSKESLASAVESAQRTATPVYTIYVEGEAEQRQRQQQNSNGGQQRRNGGIGFPGGGGGWPGGSGGGQSPGGGSGRGQKQPQISRADGKKILLEISRKTGGAMVEAKKKEDVGKMLELITTYLQAEYALSFQLDPQSTGSFHRIAVTAQDKNRQVQAPEALYSGR